MSDKLIKITPMLHMNGGSKQVADAGSVALILGSFVELLPSIAALLSVVWMLIRIYETETVQKICARLFGRKVDTDTPK